MLYEFRRVLPNRVDGIGEPLIIFIFTLRLGVYNNKHYNMYIYTRTFPYPYINFFYLFYKKISYLKVLVNAGLLVYTYQTFSFLPQEAQIWIFVALIAILFTFVLLIETVTIFYIFVFL